MNRFLQFCCLLFFFLLTAILIPVPINIQAQVANPSFGIIAPCPSCLTLTVTPSHNSSPVYSPDSNVQPININAPKPSGEPCSTGNVSIANHKSKHWKHAGALNNFMEHLINFLLEFITMLLKFFINPSVPNQPSPQPNVRTNPTPCEPQPTQPIQHTDPTTNPSVSIMQPPSGQPSIPPQSVTNGIWISQAEIMALPTRGPAWTTMQTVANSDIGTANLADQDNQHSVKTLAVAYVAVRTNNAVLMQKAKDHIMAAIETENGGRTLALGRGLGAYVIAADVIDLKTYSPTDDAKFRAWLAGVRTENIGGHDIWTTLQSTHEISFNNWHGFAGASRIAASLYLGDKADVDRAARIVRASLGEVDIYPADVAGSNRPDGKLYFRPTSDYDPTWTCDPASWVGINPDCGGLKSGAFVEDISRSAGNYPTVDETGRGYSNELMQGLAVEAGLLHRAGYDAWNWSNQALKRASVWMQDPSIGAWNYHAVGYSYAWIINKAYGTSYPTNNMADQYGRVMSWTDWTHAR